MKTALLWFKTDLRLEDNETLVKAINQADQVIPVYCLDPKQFEKTKYGFQKTGNFRTQFLLEALRDLDTNLRKLGSGLVFKIGNPEVIIPQLVAQYKANQVFAKKEIAFEEKQTESIVRQHLFKMHCELKIYSTSTLYHAEDLPFSIKNIPDVFTNFRKKTEKECTIRPVFEKPLQLNSPVIPPLTLPSISELNLKEVITDSRAVLKFRGGETEAIARLNTYFFETKSIATYKSTRNEMVGADYSTKFSPWLALGCLSPRFIHKELKCFEAKYGVITETYWLIFELLWRDYFRFMFKKYDTKFFCSKGIKPETNTKVNNEQSQLLKWINGETDSDFVNANMLELKQTGFMSNRGRQNVASYFCNELQFDWRVGAAYFESQLIDYDVSSNWGNWAYIAGVGNDPRGHRFFNVEKQALDYDKKEIYRNLWLKKK